MARLVMLLATAAVLLASTAQSGRLMSVFRICWRAKLGLFVSDGSEPAVSSITEQPEIVEPLFEHLDDGERELHLQAVLCPDRVSDQAADGRRYHDQQPIPSDHVHDRLPAIRLPAV